MLTAPCGSRSKLCGDGGLARPRRAHDQGAGAFFDAASQERIELLDFARQFRARRHLPMFRGHESRKDLNPAFLDQIVVVPASKLHAPVLDDA